MSRASGKHFSLGRRTEGDRLAPSEELDTPEVGIPYRLLDRLTHIEQTDLGAVRVRLCCAGIDRRERF